MFARFRFDKSKKLNTIASLMLCCSVLPYGAACATDASLWPQVESPVKKEAASEARIREFLSQMSVEEKVGQIMQVEIQYVTPEDIKKYHVGSVLNGGGSLPQRNKHAKPSEWLALADSFYKASMDTSDGGLAIPIIWGSDAVHGHNNVIGATIFPHNIGLGAANNPALMKRIGEITALEMRATGIDWTFAPTIAVAQNDRWGRTYESYSENPEIVKAYAGSMVLGLQGKPGTETFLDVNHVVATAKHFLGDGGTADGDDQGNAKISEKELRDIHSAGYVSAIEAGVQTVMASFSSWNGQKMHGSKYLLTDVLKGRMGFDGLVVGDWNGHGQVPGCNNASCAASVNAGLDLFMVVEDWKKLYANTLEQVQAGEIPLDRLDDAVARILRVKLRAGLFEKGMPSGRGVAGQDDIIGRAEHREVARQAVRESLVLLKNNGHVLPLKPTQTILVAGDGADNIGKQTGGWTISWQGTGNVNSDFPGASSIYQGIKEAVGEAGGEAVLSADGSFDEKPDVAIVVIGEEPYAEGQGDLETLEFEPGAKKSLKLIKSFKDAGIPVVTVFLSGRPLWVNPELNASDGFVAAWLPGTEGEGVADVLIADKAGQARHDFKGKLSFSWPKSPLQDTLNKYHEGYDPQFAYGYGMTYASDTEVPMLAEDVEGVQSGDLSDIKLYAGRTIAPWMIILSDEGSYAQLSGAYAALPTGSGKISQVDKDIQGDALRLEMNAATAGNIAISAGPALDWSAEYTRGAAFTFDVDIESVEGGSVSLQCGEDCTRTYDLSVVFENLEGKGWQTVTLPLVCLADEGDTFDVVTEPFRLTAEGPADLTVANVALRLGHGADRCPM
ncbi:glycoside hydrolase family 3 protein [Kordiimonas aestuarii]|uniref:glycoside hydrolase family 3 protein n=1 Tax=Kordiimonas aestuarii TaxID=1005925 RepID=UPI0021D09BC5|nr:glycoside hydrolase family 3 protein [Kordiimonas aestuarii]